jgi:hypothetical protein
MGAIDMSEKQAGMFKRFFAFFKTRSLWQRFLIAAGIFVLAGLAIQIINLALFRALAKTPVSPNRIVDTMQSIVESATAEATQTPSTDTTTAAGSFTDLAQALNELLSAGTWTADDGAKLQVSSMLFTETDAKVSHVTGYRIEELTQDDNGYRATIVFEPGSGDTAPRKGMLSVSMLDDGGLRLISDAFVLSDSYRRGFE